MEKFIDLEQKLSISIDLIQITKDYCEFNYDKSVEISALCSILEILLNNQKEVLNTLDSLAN